MGVGVESTLVADLVVTLCTSVEVWLIRRGSEFCCLAYWTESAAWKGCNLWDRIRWGRGAASIWWYRGRSSWSLNSGVHLEHPPRSIWLLAGVSMAQHLSCAFMGLGRLFKGWGSWSLSNWEIRLSRSSWCAEISLKNMYVNQVLEDSMITANSENAIHDKNGKLSYTKATGDIMKQSFNSVAI